MNDLSGCRPMAEVSAQELSPGSSVTALGTLGTWLLLLKQRQVPLMWLCWTSTCYREAALAQITAARMWQIKWIYHSVDCCSGFEECVWLGQAGGTTETGRKWRLVNCRFFRMGVQLTPKTSLLSYFFTLPSQLVLKDNAQLLLL